MPTIIWCAERESNPHGLFIQGILSPSRLPIPPSALVFQYTRNVKQVIIIHGGESFDSYESYINNLRASEINYERLKLQKKWKSWISKQMSEADVLLPTFPNGYNAVYDEWNIYFEKLIPFFSDDVQIVGHSLGAMFLAKYLHEKPLMQKIRRLILIAGVYDEGSTEDNGSFLVGDATGLEKSAKEIHLFHSRDDPVVPFTELAKYQADLPSAISHTFENQGHFTQPTFPELLEILKQKIIPTLRDYFFGGTYGSRTRLQGFADLCVTAPPTRHFSHYSKN